MRWYRHLFLTRTHWFPFVSAQDTFGQYLKATGHGTAAKAIAAQDKYGFNQFEVPVPAFMSLLKDHLVAPFFCFQVSCSVISCVEKQQQPKLRGRAQCCTASSLPERINKLFCYPANDRISPRWMLKQLYESVFTSENFSSVHRLLCRSSVCSCGCWMSTGECVFVY